MLKYFYKVAVQEAKLGGVRGRLCKVNQKGYRGAVWSRDYCGWWEGAVEFW